MGDLRQGGSYRARQPLTDLKYVERGAGPRDDAGQAGRPGIAETLCIAYYSVPPLKFELPPAVLRRGWNWKGRKKGTG